MPKEWQTHSHFFVKEYVLYAIIANTALGAREVEGGTTKYKLEQTGIIERQN